MTKVKIRKKLLVLVILLMIGTNGKSFCQSIEEYIAEQGCRCLDSLNTESSQVFEKSIECLKSSFTKNEKIIAHFDTLGIKGDSYQAGYEWGEKQAPVIMAQMIFSCDQFYYLVEELRNSGFQNIDSIELVRDSQRADSIMLSGGSKIKGYFTKATNFLFPGNLDSALVNANRTIDLYSEFSNGYLIRGWIYERMSRYAQAKSDYEICYSLRNGPKEAIVFIKIAERKIRDSE